MGTAGLVRSTGPIIISTVFREDYLSRLRQMTRRSDPSALIKSLRYGHDFTARIARAPSSCPTLCGFFTAPAAGASLDG
jgi:hypothetical protein